MPSYKAPLENMKFVLHEVLNAEQLAGLRGYDSATSDLVNQILEEGAKVCEEGLFPLNQSGDQEGCLYDSGHGQNTIRIQKRVSTFFVREGGPPLRPIPTYGGMGMPHLLNFALMEMICSANMSFGMYPGLSEGAYRAIHLHGSDEIKNIYLPKLVSGEWSGTMCLTESHCGTDLGLIRTRAVPSEGGSYKITGTKIFISAGEHDLTENIIHLVLARLPDAPEGVKGISLFVVPKFLPDTMASNHVMCGAIEHKMGIKASATCVMNFDDCARLVDW
jgi:alkylation response protein AidB-like acyl-CoA dehydrogenase